MKISLNWLKDYVSFSLTADQLAHKLTMAGLAVERVEKADGDTVFELEITPNRPDCLNVLGIAREISAILNVTLKTPSLKSNISSKSTFDIQIEDKKGCLRYMGVLIEGVSVKGTPREMAVKLNAVGLRCINNIVDITNFSLMENGQPLHAFDYDKLDGGTIIVRRALKGERIVTIDEEEVSLDPSILVIADAKKPVAIAGIMGGKDTEVTHQTKNILLESAYFDPVLIRRTARKIGIASDSSYRFERGVDFNNVKGGSIRALSLILDNAGGRIKACSDIVAVAKKKPYKSISISVAKMNFFLGADLSPLKYKTILKKLGCKVKGQKGILQIHPPSFREDLKDEVDIGEEVARIIGYDNLPLSLPLIKAGNVLSHPYREKRKKLSLALTALGLNEVISYTMLGGDWIKKTRQDNIPSMRITNPLTVDQEFLRPSFLPGFLSIVRSNLNHGQKNLKLFEIGKVYPPAGEKETLGIIITGTFETDWRVNPKGRMVDFYDIKGILVEVLESLDIQLLSFAESSLSFLTSGMQAKVMYGKKEIGYVGQVDEEILRECDVKQPMVYYAELVLEEVFRIPQGIYKFIPVPEYPAIVRDISLAVDKKVRFEDVKETACKFGGSVLQSIQFTEEYLGEKIPSSQRGLVFSLTYQDASRTLTEEAVNTLHQQILKQLVSDFSATIR